MSAMTTISTEHITKTLDIAIYHDIGKTPAEMVEMFPSINETDVHAAIANDLDHRAEIEEGSRRAHEVAERLRHLFPSKLVQKLAAAKSTKLKQSE